MEDVKFKIPESRSSPKEILRNLHLTQVKKTIQVKALKVMLICSIRGKEPGS